MFQKIKNAVTGAIAYCKTWFENCMTKPDVNSRFAFLTHSVLSSLAIFILALAFIWAKPVSQQEYAYMVLALGGCQTGSAVGRYFTKKNGDDPGKSE